MSSEQASTGTETTIRGITMFRSSSVPTEFYRARTVNERLRVATLARNNGNRELANLALYDAFFHISTITEAQDVNREALAQGNAYLARRANAWKRSNILG